MKKQRGKSYSQSDREGILSAYQKSGLGITQWCKDQGFNKGTLRTWLRRYGRVTKDLESSGVPSFAPVELVAPKGIHQVSSFLQVHYPNGVRVSIESEVALKLLHDLIYLEDNV